jgi:hypothetical protein
MELDNLKNTPTRKEPLDPTYDRALGQLNRQSEENVKLGFKILFGSLKPDEPSQ